MWKGIPSHPVREVWDEQLNLLDRTVWKLGVVVVERRHRELQLYRAMAMSEAFFCMAFGCVPRRGGSRKGNFYIIVRSSLSQYGCG